MNGMSKVAEKALRNFLIAGCLLPISAQAVEVLQVCPEQSLVTVVVDRAGGLSRFAHQHLISIHTLAGEVQLQSPLGNSTAELMVLLADMDVDKPELRKAAGLEGTLSAKAITKTRRNMLKKVLHASQYPELLISIDKFNQTDVSHTDGSFSLRIRLYGKTIVREIPAVLELVNDSLRAKGEFRIKQSAFGIKPFSAALGLISVADELIVVFDVVAASDC